MTTSNASLPRLLTAMSAGLLLCFGGAAAPGQSGAGGTRSLADVNATLERDLAAANEELSAVLEQLRAEKEPLYAELRRLEGDYAAARAEFNAASQENATRLTKIANLQRANDRLDTEVRYLSGRLGEFASGLQGQVNGAELQRYEKLFVAANRAAERATQSPANAFEAQLAVVDAALDRIADGLGGVRFEGSATDSRGEVTSGTFALVGPYALFRSKDGREVGTVETRQGKVLPSVVGFSEPSEREAASHFVQSGEGVMPFDPTLGKAQQLVATEQTWVEHVKAGGVIMIPIGVMAGFALLVALYKWLRLSFVGKASKAQVAGLLAAVGEGDDAAALQWAGNIHGPVGRMLEAGCEHISEPRELIEEVMFERVLTSRLQLQSLLPFIAICAASAPLLGLLGTVTGIIDTFEAITVFGSGDVKVLSGGISKALITTEYGLIVAIPALLLHAFLSRKAASIVGSMETAAVSLVNEIGRARALRGENAPAAESRSPSVPDPALVRAQVSEILAEILGTGHDELRDTRGNKAGAKVQPA